MTRTDLYHWIEPYCLPDRVSIMYQKASGLGPGWTDNQTDSQRAKAAWLAGKLEQESFDSTTAEGTPYRIARGQRLGLVAHRLGFVGRFCIDLDAHEGGVDTTGLADRMDSFLGAKAIRFTSKSGKGLHLFYALVDPMPVTLFVAWAQSWGFNRAGQPECFPKTEKLSQVWLPNEANENGGDRHLGGDPLTCIVQSLPVAPTMPANVSTPRATPSDGDDKPGTLFARSATPWSEILADGSVCVREIDCRGHWRRPGKFGGQISGTTGVCRSDDGREFLYVFSSNWHPFEQNRCYDKFQAYALLRHGGDFAAAASELGAAGWGAPEIGNDTGVDLSSLEQIETTEDGEIVEDDNTQEQPERPGKLPQSIYKKMPGVISEIIEYNLETALYPQPELALASALAIISTLTGRKICDSYGTRTNLYIFALAETGAGKDQSRKVIRNVFSSAKCEILEGPEEVASASGIISSLHEHPCRLLQLDEIADVFGVIRAAGNKAQHLAGILRVLKTLYSSSGGEFRGGGYASTDRNKTIDQPHLVIYGCGTEEFWEHISPKNVSDGTLGRALVFGPVKSIVYRGQPRRLPVPATVTQYAHRWSNFFPGGLLNKEHPEPVTAKHTKEAFERIESHLREISERSLKEKGPRKAIWQRTGEKTNKLALCFAAARVDSPEGSVIEVGIEDVELAIQLSNWSTRMIVSEVFDKVFENERERNAKRILRLLRAEGPKSKNWITRKTQGMTTHARDDLLKDLAESGQIIQERISTKGKPKIILHPCFQPKGENP